MKRTPRWQEIDTVLLDMDGTLLDRHFDDHFWLEHVPAEYARSRGIGLAEAKRELFAKYRGQEGTLNWTDLDYWSERLGLDIPELKRQVDHLIAVHPGVVEFLEELGRSGRRVWLVTNAHGKTLDLKMEKTSLAGLFHRVFTSARPGACWRTTPKLSSSRQPPSAWASSSRWRASAAPANPCALTASSPSSASGRSCLPAVSDPASVDRRR
jgi:FMN phosphatase YigB (HAD superfamily)